ncbi:MAG: glycosyltransferase family 1 protein [Nitrospirae bacterium]|nr:MAG: glycosyltransferase family 1 protein [Nitrospirota bacterium]
MRILVIFSSSELGGAERSLTRMARESSEVVQYDLATLDGEGPWTEWVRELGIQPLVLGERSQGLGHGRFGVHALCRLVSLVRRNRYSAVYVIGLRASIALRFLKPWLAGAKLVHGIRWNPDSDSRLDRFFRLTERLTHRLVDAWITNSTVAKQTLVSRCGISAERIFVIYNGLASLPADVPPLTERPMEVLTVANLNRRKGHREYLQVVREVLKTVPEAKFVFVGRDDMNGEIQSAIEDAGLYGHVYYEGFQANVSSWFSRARLMVLPSLWGEGCPTSVLEAFSYGVPVVAYSIDGIPELIDNGVDGVAVSPNKWEELASIIVHVLQDPVRAENMGMAGREKVASRFTLARCADEHAQTFQQLGLS